MERTFKTKHAQIAGLALLLALTWMGRAVAAGPRTATDRENPFVVRQLQVSTPEGWVGTGIAYGPHRDGQRPGGPNPDRDQMREDLHLMAKHWRLLRMYSARGPAETALEVIRADGLDMKVMLGAWIAVEEHRGEDGEVLEAFPQAREENRAEVATAIRLANAYPDIVVAVCVGNETQVFWSAHRSPVDILIGYVREVRAGTSTPVTVADDFNFWNKPESDAVAREIDLVVMHAHPLWNGKTIDEALAWTVGTYDEIRAAHPDRTVVLGETGWATQKHNVGEQAELIKGAPGEAPQRVFYEEITAWAKDQRVVLFFFEAFDENWKGGEHPDEVEKHWGLFRADRTPKAALAGREQE